MEPVTSLSFGNLADSGCLDSVGQIIKFEMLLDGLKLLSNSQQGKCEMVFKLISLAE